MALTVFEEMKPQCTILCLWEIEKSKWQEQESPVLRSTSTNKSGMVLNMHISVRPTASANK